MKLYFDGLDKLVAGLKKANQVENKVKEVVSKHGAGMQQKAQRFAPVDTGNLKRMIDLEIEDGGLSAKVESKADYAPYQEYGTRFQSGTPHIRPAFNASKDGFIRDCERVVDGFDKK